MNLKRENEWRRIDVNLLGKKKQTKKLFSTCQEDYSATKRTPHEILILS